MCTHADMRIPYHVFVCAVIDKSYTLTYVSYQTLTWQSLLYSLVLLLSAATSRGEGRRLGLHTQSSETAGLAQVATADSITPVTTLSYCC